LEALQQQQVLLLPLMVVLVEVLLLVVGCFKDWQQQQSVPGEVPNQPTQGRQGLTTARPQQQTGRD
jgi:hypothetical protein